MKLKESTHLILILACAVGFAPANPSHNPSHCAPEFVAACWNFDDTGLAIQRDNTGNNRHLQLQGEVTWAPGVRNSAIRFVSQQYGSVHNLPVPTGDFSISTWVRTPQKDALLYTFLKQQNPSGNLEVSSLLELQDNHLFFSRQSSGPRNNMTGTKSIELQEGLSEWTHLTAVQNGDKNLIYVNGDLVNAENISDDLSFYNLSEFEEGGYVGNVLNINNGNVFLDEMAIWSKALSQREIDSLYAAAVNQPPVILTTRLKPATEDVFYTDTLRGSDPEASPLSWALLSGPNLLELNSETGILSFTPTQEETGMQPVTVEVTDGALRDTATFFLEIVEVNEPPRIDSTFPFSQVYKVDSSYAWPVSAFDEEGDSLSWTLHGPQNMVLEEDSLKWTPSISQLGLDTLTLMVQDGSLADTAMQIFLVLGPTTVGTSPSIQNAFSIRTKTDEIRQGATEVYFPDNQPWSVSAFNLNGRQVGIYRETGSGWHALNLKNTGAAVLILRQGNRQAIFNIP